MAISRGKNSTKTAEKSTGKKRFERLAFSGQGIAVRHSLSLQLHSGEASTSPASSGKGATRPKGLTYRTGEFEYESDFCGEFLLSPDAMVTEKVRNWLSRSGLSQRVLDPASCADPTYVLEGNVIALYGDFRAKASPKGVMEIRVFLLEMKTSADRAVVFGKSYKSSVALESKGPAGLVSALDRCLVEILSDLEKDLAERLQ